MNLLKTILAWTVLVVAACLVIGFFVAMVYKAWPESMFGVGVVAFIAACLWALGFLEKKYNPETDDDEQC